MVCVLYAFAGNKPPENGILPARSGLGSPFQTRSMRVAVPCSRATPIFSSDAEGTSLCGRVSKTQLARGSTGTPRHFPKMEAVVCQLALQAGDQRVRTPSGSHLFHWAARLVSKSAGLHPAVRGA